MYSQNTYQYACSLREVQNYYTNNYVERYFLMKDAHYAKRPLFTKSGGVLYIDILL